MDPTDEDGDSAMHSTPEDQEDEMFPPENGPTTPRLAQASSDLSPPTSRGRGLLGADTIAPAAASTASASLTNNGAETATLQGQGKIVSSRGGAGANKVGQTQTHKASGYTWDRDEDSPGWTWRNKKAMEESLRAWDHIVNKDKMIKRAYGDVLAPRAAGI